MILFNIIGLLIGLYVLEASWEMNNGIGVALGLTATTLNIVAVIANVVTTFNL